MKDYGPTLPDDQTLVAWAREQWQRQEQEAAQAVESRLKETLREAAEFNQRHRRLEEMEAGMARHLTGEAQAEHQRWQASPDADAWREERAARERAIQADQAETKRKHEREQELSRKLDEARWRREGDRNDPLYPKRKEAERARMAARAVEQHNLWSAEEQEVRAAVKQAEETVRARYRKVREERAARYLKEDLG